MTNDRLLETIEAIAYIAPLKDSIIEINENRDAFAKVFETATYEEVLKNAGISETEVSREQFKIVADFLKALTQPN